MKAVIQTNKATGVHRVFSTRYVGNRLKTVYHTKPSSAYKVTCYTTNLDHLAELLADATPVYNDEELLYNGQSCELSLFGG